MTDRIGALDLPVPLPDDQLLSPVGDPGLGLLASFMQAVLNAECGDAWHGIEPAPVGVELDAPVRYVRFHNPEVFGFNDEDLPALFVWRDGGSQAREAEERYVEMARFQARWILPPLPKEEQRERAPGLWRAAAAALGAALTNRRHDAWTDPDDPTPGVQPVVGSSTSFALSQATTTSAAAIALTGPLGSTTLASPVAPTITTTPATGAYNTTDPFKLVIVDGFGRTIERRLRLTNPNGGETITLEHDTYRLVSVNRPAMLTTSGAISVGNAAYAGRPSSLGARAGFERVQLTNWLPAVIHGDRLDGDQHVDTRLPFHAVAMTIETREVLVQARRGVVPIQGSGPGATVGGSIQLEYLLADGSVFEESALPTDP